MGNCYKKNFVKQVVAQLDFMAPVDVFSRSDFVAGLDEIKKRFPIAEQSQGSRQSIEFGQEGVRSRDSSEFPVWKFNGINRQKTLTLNRHLVQVVLNTYGTEGDLEEDLIVPVSQVLRAHPNILIQRTGVRFVNVFDFPELNFENAADYFSNAIAGHLRFVSPRENISRAFLITEFVYDDLKLRLQSGFFNPDYPAAIQRNHFVVDLDAFVDFPHTIESTETHFRKVHHKIEEHFESSITDKLRNEVLNG